MPFFDASTLFLSWSFSARSWAWASLSRSRSPATTLNSDLASNREAFMDACSLSSATIFSFDEAKEARVLKSSALADSSCTVVDVSRDRHSSSPWEAYECKSRSLSTWFWSWFFFASTAFVCSNYLFKMNVSWFTKNHMNISFTKNASSWSNCRFQVAWAGPAVVDELWTSDRLRDERRNESRGFGETDRWRFGWIYAWSSDPCDIKKGEEAPKMYIRHRNSTKKI